VGDSISDLRSPLLPLFRQRGQREATPIKLLPLIKLRYPSLTMYSDQKYRIYSGVLVGRPACELLSVSQLVSYGDGLLIRQFRSSP
jgi:hypothetical protein